MHQRFAPFRAKRRPILVEPPTYPGVAAGNGQLGERRQRADWRWRRYVRDGCRGSGRGCKPCGRVEGRHGDRSMSASGDALVATPVPAY